MKTLFAFALAMSMSLSVFASPNTTPENKTLETHSGISYRYQTVKLTLLEGIGKVTISVLDEKGNSLHADIIRINESVVYPINMSNVPAGNYTVRLVSKEGSIDYPVQIQPQTGKAKAGK